MKPFNASWTRQGLAAAGIVGSIGLFGCGGAPDDQQDDEIGTTTQAACKGVLLSSSTPGPLPSPGSALLTASGVTCGAGMPGSFARNVAS
jgi:hypothetical protein